MTELETLWEAIRRNLPRDRWLPLQELYVLVERHVTLEPDDFLPDAPGSGGLRWQRNVRNVLQSRKTTGEVLWDPNLAAYRMPPGDSAPDPAREGSPRIATGQDRPSQSQPSVPIDPATLGALDSLGLRKLLSGFFGDYHSSIATQEALVDALLQRVATETRDHCARIAADIGARQTIEAAMETADAIARAIRAGR